MTVDTPALPTALPGETPAKTAPSELERIAQAFYNSMSAAGIPVRLTENRDGELAVVEFALNDPSDWFMYSTPTHCGAMGGGTFEQIDREVWNEFLSRDPNEPRLVINGVDYSEAYGRCIKATGYDEARARGHCGVRAPTPFLRGLVDISTAWAQCARANGWPQTRDPVMPAPDSTDWPMAVLPVTITTDEFRDLLQACPPLLVDPLPQTPEGDKTVPPWPPEIGFDYPGFRGVRSEAVPPSDRAGQKDDPIVQHIWELSQIMAEELKQGYEPTP